MNERKPPEDIEREVRRILGDNLDCPAADRLVAFHGEELAPAEAATVAAYCGVCTECTRLIEELDEAERPLGASEDDAYRTAREEDRAIVARELGFRVGRPPSRPLLERLSWLWEARTPALVPAALLTALLLVAFWPARPEQPVTVFGPTYRIISTDQVTRNAAKQAEHSVPEGALLSIEHAFVQKGVAAGTMVNREITGPNGPTHLDPITVELIDTENGQFPGISFAMTLSKPGRYRLRLSHPGNAFEPVTLGIEILQH